MKKHILIFSIFFLPLSLMAEIPLEKAVAQGIQRNMSVKNLVLEEKNSFLEKRKAEKNRLFGLELGGSYLYQSDRMEISFEDFSPFPGSTIPGQNITAGTFHNFDVKMSLVQPLFTGNILKNMVASQEIQTVIAQKQTYLQKLEIAGQIKTSYFRYRLLMDQKGILEALLKKLEIHHQKLLDFYRENLIRKSDLLETEAQIQEQKINLEDLENTIIAEKIHFENLCGLDVEEISDNYKETARDFREALSLFETRHPVLKTLDEQVKLIDIKKQIISGRYLPQVAGFAEVHFGKPGIDYFKNEWSPYFIGGINVNFKLFDGKQKKIDLEILAHSQEKIKNQQADFLREGEKVLRQLFEKKKSTEKQLEILEQLLTLAREDSLIKKDLVREKQISNLDYLASLTTEERYASMRNSLISRHELIKLNINTLTGIYEEES
ncbi:MAG: TolC family protein [Candidatus Aminicenantes bacterium]|nr:TolC family protein [Candidatus Aminicenantes bacterium]